MEKVTHIKAWFHAIQERYFPIDPPVAFFDSYEVKLLDPTSKNLDVSRMSAHEHGSAQPWRSKADVCHEERVSWFGRNSAVTLF